jgi:ureidoglycolate hydrolase
VEEDRILIGGFVMKTIKAQHISNEIFKGLGRAIRITPETKSDARDDIQTYYGQLAIMQCDSAIQLGICVAKNREYVVTEMEQHMRTAELLAALKGDFITLAAPSVETGGRLRPDLSRAVAVRVGQGEGVFFDEGIWHWTPYAITPACDVLVAFKKDTPKDDFISYKLDEPVRMEI